MQALTNHLLNHDPERTAIIAKGQRCSYGELAVRVREVANVLHQIGAEEGARIGILFGNCPEFAYALLGAWSVGASAILLSTYFRAQELRRYCKTLAVEYVLTDVASEALLRTTFVTARRVTEFCVVDAGSVRLYHLGDVANTGAAGPHNEAVIQFTSGVAGSSKIIGRTVANLIDEIQNYSITVALTEDDRVLCLTPLFHAYGLVNGLLPVLAFGSQLVLTGRFSPREVPALAVAMRPSIVLGVPFMYELLANTEGLSENTFANCRFCFSAGGKLERIIAESFLKQYGRAISQLYGSTETGIVAVNLYESSGDTVESVGRPVLGREVEIVNDEDVLCAVGMSGNLRIRSSGTTPGYIRSPELTAASFRNGWYYPGDIGFKDDDGNITITGRKSTFINVAGMKVDPFEVETVLRAIPGVRDAAVVGKQPRSVGITNEIVKAFVVCEPPLLSRHEIIAACRQEIAEYKVPREFEFVDQLPRSPMGKLLVKYLIE